MLIRTQFDCQQCLSCRVCHIFCGRSAVLLNTVLFLLMLWCFCTLSILFSIATLAVCVGYYVVLLCWCSHFGFLLLLRSFSYRFLLYCSCAWMCFCPVFVLLFPMLLFCFPCTLLLVCLLLSLLGLGPDESLVSSTSFTNDLEIQWLQPDMCESCMRCYIYNICDNFVLHQVRQLSSDALHYLWTSLSSNFENQYTIIIV